MTMATDAADMLGFRLGNHTARLRGVPWKPTGGSSGRAFARVGVLRLKDLLAAEANLDTDPADWLPAAEHLDVIQGIMTAAGHFIALDPAEDLALSPRDETGRPVSPEILYAARETIALNRLPLTGIRFNRSSTVGRFRTSSGPVRFNAWDAFRLHGVVVNPAREPEYLERLAAALAVVEPLAPKPRARAKASA